MFVIIYYTYHLLSISPLLGRDICLFYLLDIPDMEQ